MKKLLAYSAKKFVQGWVLKLLIVTPIIAGDGTKSDRENVSVFGESEIFLPVVDSTLLSTAVLSIKFAKEK